MKKIKELTVKVTYEVTLNEINMPGFVGEEMEESYIEECGTVEEGSLIYEWIYDNISQSDANHWEFEIINLETND